MVVPRHSGIRHFSPWRRNFPIFTTIFPTHLAAFFTISNAARATFAIPEAILLTAFPTALPTALTTRPTALTPLLIPRATNRTPLLIPPQALLAARPTLLNARLTNKRRRL